MVDPPYLLFVCFFLSTPLTAAASPGLSPAVFAFAAAGFRLRCCLGLLAVAGFGGDGGDGRDSMGLSVRNTLGEGIVIVSAINRGLAQLHHQGTIAFGQPELGEGYQTKILCVAEEKYNKRAKGLDKGKEGFGASSNQGFTMASTVTKMGGGDAGTKQRASALGNRELQLEHCP